MINQQTSDRLEGILQNDYRFQFGEYISKGFNIFGRNAGMFIGYFILYIGITIVLGIIPFLGQIVSFLIGGALAAGVYIVADKTERNEDTQFGNFFDGFQSWVPLMLSVLLQVVIYLAVFIPFFAYIFLTIGISSFMGGEKPEFSSSQAVTFGLMMLAFFCVLFYFAFSFIYAPMFIVFDKMDAWESLMMSRRFVSKHFFTHFFFLFAWGFIIMISALPLLLGLLVTIPAVACSIYAAWADITDYHVEKADDDDLMRHLIG
jgi:hypothetical protein